MNWTAFIEHWTVNHHNPQWLLFSSHWQLSEIHPSQTVKIISATWISGSKIMWLDVWVIGEGQIKRRGQRGGRRWLSRMGEGSGWGTNAAILGYRWSWNLCLRIWLIGHWSSTFKRHAVAEVGHERAWGRADTLPCCFYHGWQPPLCKVCCTPYCLSFNSKFLIAGVEGKRPSRGTRVASTS